jgi:hypothetical protein
MIVNLTMPVVLEEVDRILRSYPYYPYQQVFALPSLRQKLVTYVLSRVPGLYTVVEDSDPSRSNVTARYCTAEQKQQINQLLHQGIEHIIGNETNWNGVATRPANSMNNTPSHWFG